MGYGGKRVIWTKAGVANLLDDHVVAPVVAVVLGVDEPIHAARDHDAQPQALRLVDRRLAVELPERRIAVAAAVDVEFPEVREGSAHGHLDCLVQGLQRRRQGHVDAPPDLRLQPLQLDAQPRNPLAHRPVPSVLHLPDSAYGRHRPSSTGALHAQHDWKLPSQGARAVSDRFETGRRPDLRCCLNGSCSTAGCRRRRKCRRPANPGLPGPRNGRRFP